MEELLPIFSSFIFEDKHKQQRLFMPDNIRESVWWEGTTESPSSRLPLTVGSTLILDQFTQHFSRQEKASSKDRDSTASLGYMIQCLIVWIFFSPYNRSQHPVFQFMTIAKGQNCFPDGCVASWLPGRTLASQSSFRNSSSDGFHKMATAPIICFSCIFI